MNEDKLVETIKEQWDKRREIKKRKKEQREKRNKEERDGMKEFEKKEVSNYERDARRKKWRKFNKVVEEELVPKKDGFARRVEKRQMKHRQMNRVGDNDSFDHFGSRDKGLEYYKRRRDDKRRQEYGREKRAYQ